MEYQNDKLIIARTFNAPIEAVWNALTEYELIKQWSPFFFSGFKAEIGFEGRFLLGPDPEHQYLHISKVIEVINNQKLTYTWAYDGQPGESRVTWELSNGGKTTEVVFTHEITKPFPSDDPIFALTSFVQGWTHTVNALEEFVSNGSIL